MFSRLLLTSVAALGFTVAASAQNFSEDFEAPAWAVGDLAEGAGVNGWVGWDSIVHPQAVIGSTQAIGAQSLHQTQGCDTVNELAFLADSGRWRVTGNAYMASTNSGPTYFILLNDYNSGGPYQWSAQFFFDGSVVSCDCGSNGTVTMPMVSDAWVSFTVEIDFDEPDPLGNPVDGVATVSYDDGTNSGTFPSYAWASGVFGGSTHPDSKIDAIDLYPAGITGEFYWDDIAIESLSVGTPDCTSFPNSTGSPSELTGTGSDSVLAGDLILSASPLPDNVQGIIYYGAGNNVIPFGDGLRCVSGAVQRHQLGNAAGPNNGSPAGTFVADPFDPAQNNQSNVAIAAGTLYFQLWHRDPAGPLGTGFNFSNSLAITFNP